MRPNFCWAVLQASVLAVLLLTLDADSQASGCRPGIRVRRNTFHKAPLGGHFKISCKFVFCNNSPPQISWHKLFPGSSSPIPCNETTRIKTKYEISDNSSGTSYLIFENILTSDSGLYNCQAGGSVGHSINVLVSGHVELTTVTSKNETNSTLSPDPDIMDTLWVYVYLAAGVVVLVVIVIIISVVSMQGCKGKSRKEKQTQHQFIEIPMSQQPSSHPSLQRPPRRSPPSNHVLYNRGPESIYDNAPSRRPGWKNATPLDPDQMTFSAGNDHVYGGKKEVKRKMEKAEEEEESHVLYAALSHHMLPGISVQPPRPKEDSSEYAAIRVP